MKAVFDAQTATQNKKEAAKKLREDTFPAAMTGTGYERHSQKGTGHGESTPSCGLKILVPDTGQVDPEPTFVS
jgi:hypothetical protein